MQLAILDMDGTLFPGALGVELARQLAVGGAPVEVEALEQILTTYAHGDMPYPQMTDEAHRIYSQGLTGLSVTEVESAAAAAWRHVRIRLHDYVRPAIRALRSAGFRILLLSGSPEEVVRLAAEDLGVDKWAGAKVAVHDGKYTGELLVAPGLIGQKSRVLTTVLPTMPQADLSRSLAIGNGPSDVEILESVGCSLVFEPDPSLEAVARVRNWTFVDRLSALNSVRAFISTAAPAREGES